MAGTEMTTRILKMYDILSRGKEIYKLSYCMENEISTRTFERDIEKIRLFFSEEYSGHDVEFNPEKGSYSIPGARERGALSFFEFCLLIKILKGGQVLEKNEFLGLLYSLHSVTVRGYEKEIQRIVQKEYGQYIEREGQKAFLKLFGDLEKCITERNIIRIRLNKVGDSIGEIKICPVAIEYSGLEFYLLGYQTVKNTELVVFALEEINSFQITSSVYQTEIGQQYCYKDGQQLIRQEQKKRGGSADEAD